MYAIQAIASEDSSAVAAHATRVSAALGDRYAIRVVHVAPWFKLHIGEFETRAQAQPGLRELRSSGYPDAWVTNGVSPVAGGGRVAGSGRVVDDRVAADREPELNVPSQPVEAESTPAQRPDWVAPERPSTARSVDAQPATERAGRPRWVAPELGATSGNGAAARPNPSQTQPVGRPEARPGWVAPETGGASSARDVEPRAPIEEARAGPEVPAADPDSLATPAASIEERPVAAASTAETEIDLAARRIPMDLPRVTRDIVIDGVIDDAAWATIEPYPISVYSPTYGQDPTERSEFRVTYDDEYIYVAGSLYDSDPGGIQANSFYRDAGRGDDEFTIVLDSYNDYETALSFSANPNGARSDRSIANDGQFILGQPTQNSDWNAHWDLATSRSDEGWFAEMRIPFSTLGFQVDGDEVVMGMSVYRSISRKNERHTFPNVSPAWGFFGFGKPSLAQRVRFTGIQRRAPLYITPYVLGGVTSRPELREPPDVESADYFFDDDYTREPGVDIKWSPSSSLSVDLTANTDFAQVEADDQQINLTRFPLFFPEKRQFFQSRSSTFDFGTGGFTDRLFFSRRIGLDQGEIVRIYGGARLVGQMGGLDYGLLNMQTASRDGRPGENMGVFRLKQQVFNPFSWVGGMVTTRLGDTGENNVAYGLDAEIRPFGDEYLTVKWAQTFDEVIQEGSVLDAGLIRARWERRKEEGVSYAGEYGRVGPDYLPRLGFQSRTDFSLFGGELNYSWFMGQQSKLRTVSVGVNTQHYFRNSDQTAESRSISPTFLVGLKNGGFFIFSATSSFESIRDPFRAAGIQIDPGEYWFHEFNGSFRWPRSLPIRGQISGSVGSFYDGRRASVSTGPTFNLSSHLQVQPNYSLNRFEFDGDELTAHLASLRLDFALNTRLSLSTFGQYNSVADQSTINARLRYHFSEGTDLWVVYNEGFNMDRDLFDPRLPLSSGRSLLVKYSHTLGF